MAGRQLEPPAATTHAPAPAPGRGSVAWRRAPRGLRSLGPLPAFTALRKAQGCDLDFTIYIADFIMFRVLSCFLPLQFHSFLWGHGCEGEAAPS